MPLSQWLANCFCKWKQPGAHSPVGIHHISNITHHMSEPHCTVHSFPLLLAMQIPPMHWHPLCISQQVVAACKLCCSWLLVPAAAGLLPQQTLSLQPDAESSSTTSELSFELPASPAEQDGGDPDADQASQGHNLSSCKICFGVCT